ncbi:MAG: inositol monophosphatase family protein [Burkholderiaceae bacterium]
MSDLLDLAVQAARAGAAVIDAATRSADALQVRAKRPNDFVTQVDLASEAAIVRTLLQAHPDHAVRGEESAVPHGNADADHVWIVDPLDGTNNFIHGWPHYAVSVALAVRGRVEVGVVLDVTRGDVYRASRGGGAWCNGLRLSVSARARLADAVIASTCPIRPGPDFDAAMQVLGRVLAGASAVRRSGSAALDLAWLAAGRCDAQFDRGLAPWDVAAGALLVQEAGGLVTTFSGEPDFLEARECLAGNATLHAALGEILRA